MTQAQVVGKTVLTHTAETALSGVLPRVWRAITTWVETAAEYQSEAATYDALRALSDAELSRLGLSGTTLGHDVRAAYDRAEG